MDNLTLAQKLMGKEKTTEQKSELVNPSSASIVYMVAVTSSSGGEVVLKDEVDDTAEWEDGDFTEVDEDGDFEEYESEDDPLEDVDDTVVDMTDGDGVDIEDTDAEAVSFSVADYHEAAVAALAEEEAEAVGDDLPDEDATISDEIDDGDAEVIPDVGEDNEDALPDEDATVDEVSDDEYTLTDDNSDDESDEPITGAEVSDGYTVANCIGSIKAGDRVAVMIQDGRMTVLGVVGSGDEEEALRKQAEEAADEASEAAAVAQEKAEQAEETAAGAAQDATEAKQQADAANTAATNAQTAANQAQTEAQEAAQKADDAKAKADAVEENMAEVSAEVDSVKEDAVKIRADLEAEIATVRTTMSQTYATKDEVSTTETTLRSEFETSIAGIQSTFAQDYAKKTELDDAIISAKAELQTQITQNADSIALTAKSVEDIQVDITAQDGKIATAIQTANDAQTVANQAQTDATEAQTAADEAKAQATAANTAATNAQTEADEAKTKAQAAQELADAAKTDLATAQAKLAEVESNAAANAEDIEQAQQAVADAQAAVEVAQAAADKAKQDAAAAQSTADQAKADASAANTAASNAQTKADEAKIAADNAQVAADEAKEELEALTNRVVTCETRIDQNSELIALTATKTELSTAIDNIEVGGRNLLLNSSFTKDFEKWTVGNVELVTVDGVTCAHVSGQLKTTKNATQSILGKIDVNDLSQTYVFSADIKLDNYLAGTTNPFASLYIIGSYNNNGTSTWMGATIVSGSGGFASYNNAGWVRVSYIVKFDHVPTDLSVAVYARDFTGDLYYKNLKLEKGNKATDWTPAPEDQDAATQAVADNLANNYYNKTQTDAQIQLKADSILSTVSATYQTIDAMGIYSTTAQMNSAIEQKANSITSTVASTYLSKADAETTYSTKTEVTQTASGLEVKITTAQNTADSAASSASAANTAASVAQATAEDAAKTATNFLSYDATDGLLIGNKTNGSWDGYRTQITSSAFNILDADGTQLASYGASLVELAKNSTSATIKMCGGLGEIAYKVDEFDGEYYLDVSGENIRLVGDSAALYSGYNGGTYARTSWVTTTSDGSVNLGVSKCDSLESDGTGIWTSHYLDITTAGISGLAYAVDLCGRYGVSLSTVLGAVKVNATDGLVLPSGNSYGISFTHEISSILPEMEYDALLVKAFHMDDSGNIGVGYGLQDTGANLWLYGNYINLDATTTIYARTHMGFVNNGTGIYGVSAGGTTKQCFMPQNTNNNLVLGYGNYANAEGNTNICGNNVYLFSAAAGNASVKPYYAKGDSITVTVKTAGYVTNSKTEITFLVPLGKPVIGSPTVSAASVNGFVLRQDGNYTHGSAGSTYVKPGSYECKLRGNDDFVEIIATKATTTNAVNNSPIGILWNGTITFS